MVVSDTSPLNYLILIEQVELLPELYGTVFIPQSVAEELNAAGTPEPVRNWKAQPPSWLEVQPAPSATDDSLSQLHAGEREAILLASHLRAAALIIDERRGRLEAEKRRMQVIGTLGVLVAAHERKLNDLAAALDRLRQTSFHASPRLIESILSRFHKTADELGASDFQ